MYFTNLLTTVPNTDVQPMTYDECVSFWKLRFARNPELTFTNI